MFGLASSLLSLITSIMSALSSIAQQALNQETTLLLTIALYLAGLSYFLGALIYALPLPFPSLKQWGPTMMKDAIYVTVWVMIYNIVLSVADSILNLLGVSWSSYLQTVDSELGSLLEVYGYIIFLLVLTFIPKFIVHNPQLVARGGWAGIIIYIASFIINLALKLEHTRPVLASLATQTLSLFVFESVIASVSIIIYNGAPLLIVMGVLLMALPFRIGRNAGAMLIATTLVYYIGIPAMPLVLNKIEEAIIFGTPSTYLTALQSLEIDPFIFVPSAGPILNILSFEFVNLQLAYFFALSGFVFGLADMIAGSTGEEIIKVDEYYKHKSGGNEEEEEEED